MKTTILACVINCVLALLLSIPMFAESNVQYGSTAAGYFFLAWAVVSMLISPVCFATKRSEIGMGLLLSAGIILLAGLVVCSYY